MDRSTFRHACRRIPLLQSLPFSDTPSGCESSIAIACFVDLSNTLRLINRLQRHLLRTMAQYYQASASVPAFCTSQYSTLHHERFYLLQALAEEEERGERFTKALETLKAKLANHDPADAQVSARKLKTAIKSVRHKIGRCQYTERALSANLANVVGQIEGAKRYQWQSAHQQYSHQSPYSQVMIMSPAMPGFALQSPLPAALMTQMQYMALTAPRHHLSPWTYRAYSFGASPQLLQASVLHPATTRDQFSTTSQVGPSSLEQNQLDTRLHSPVSSISSSDLIPFSSNSDENEHDIISPLSKIQQRPWSWPEVDGVRPDIEGRSAAEDKPVKAVVAGRLCNMDAASSEMGSDTFGSTVSGE